MLSDFISESYEKPLMLSARKHDLVGIHVYDSCDQKLPEIGLFKVQDAETGMSEWVDTNDKNFQINYAKQFEKHRSYCKQVFSKSGASLLSIRTDMDYVKQLQGFFKSR